MAGLSRKGMLAFSSNYFLCSFLVNICSGSFCCCSFVPKSSHSEHLPCFSSTAPRMKHEMLGKMWPEQHRRLLALADDACRTFLRGRRSAGGTLAITVVPVTLARHCIFLDLENLAIGWKLTVFQPLFQCRSGKTGIIEVSPVFSRKIRLAASMPPPLARRAFSSDNSRTSRQCPDFLIESWGKFGKIHFAANMHIHQLIIY